MADTRRTRAAIMALLADNVTAQISAQDLRDAQYTVMPDEFVNPEDFFKQPAAVYTTTDKTARGWIDYSQYIGQDCYFGNVLFMNTSGIWSLAAASASAQNGLLGVAMNSYVAGISTAQILRKGVVYNSLFSALFSNYIGRPVYLASGSPGSIAVSISTANIIGFIEGNSWGDSAGGKWRFEPSWSVTGA
jgi:hypothetical protein